MRQWAAFISALVLGLGLSMTAHRASGKFGFDVPADDAGNGAPQPDVHLRGGGSTLARPIIIIRASAPDNDIHAGGASVGTTVKPITLGGTKGSAGNKHGRARSE